MKANDYNAGLHTTSKTIDNQDPSVATIARTERYCDTVHLLVCRADESTVEGEVAVCHECPESYIHFVTRDVHEVVGASREI